MIKKIVFSLVVIACLLTLGVGSASADALTDFLKSDALYGTNPTITEVSPNNAYSHHNTQEEATVKAKSQYLAQTGINILGYYNANAVTTPPVGSDLIQITSTLQADNVNRGYTLKPQDTGVTVFGLYYQVGSTIIYSQPKFNPGQKQYARVFSITNDQADKQAGDSIGDRYVFCFDDGKDPFDYKDLLIELHPVDVAIPEFPTMALPVAAVLGLMFIIQRRKEN